MSLDVEFAIAIFFERVAVEIGRLATAAPGGTPWCAARFSASCAARRSWSSSGQTFSTSFLRRTETAARGSTGEGALLEANPREPEGASTLRAKRGQGAPRPRSPSGRRPLASLTQGLVAAFGAADGAGERHRARARRPGQAERTRLALQRLPPVLEARPAKVVAASHCAQHRPGARGVGGPGSPCTEELRVERRRGPSERGGKAPDSHGATHASRGRAAPPCRCRTRGRPWPRRCRLAPPCLLHAAWGLSSGLRLVQELPLRRAPLSCCLQRHPRRLARAAAARPAAAERGRTRAPQSRPPRSSPLRSSPSRQQGAVGCLTDDAAPPRRAGACCPPEQALLP